MSPPGGRKKKFARKVKTGCKTCRVRRVKCDERKPTCLRCQKFGAICDQYDNEPPVASTASVPEIRAGAGLRPLAPNPKSQATPPLTVLALVKAPTAYPSDSSMEIEYFQHFQECTAASFATFFPEPVWNELTLQASLRSRCIWDAAVSLAALDRTTQAVRGSQEAIEHHEIAIRKYGKSLREMSESLASQDIRLTLVYCLLSFCFEAWKGYSNSAITQIRYGLKYVKTWMAGNNSALTGMDARLVRMFNFLETTSIFGSPETKKIDNTEEPKLNQKIARGLVGEMPAVFTEVEDARKWLEWIGREVLHEVLNFHKQQIRSVLEAAKNGTVEDPEIMEYAARRRTELRGKIERWHEAFEPLSLLAQQPANHKIFAATTLLEIRYRSGARSLAATIGWGELEFDEFRDDYAKAVDLTDKLIKHLKSNKRRKTGIFTVDGGIVSSMYAVILKCRDRVIRRQAVELLEQNPRREGLWDSVLVAKIGRLCIAIEEEGLAPDVIVPRGARLIGTAAFSAMEDREGTLAYLRLVPKPGLDYLVPKQESMKFTW